MGCSLLLVCIGLGVSCFTQIPEITGRRLLGYSVSSYHILNALLPGNTDNVNDLERAVSTPVIVEGQTVRILSLVLPLSDTHLTTLISGSTVSDYRDRYRIEPVCRVTVLMSDIYG